MFVSSPARPRSHRSAQSRATWGWAMDSIELRVFPLWDDSFNRAVKSLASELQPAAPESLEAALRAAYPDVRVSRQSSLASIGGGTVWYVYRDDEAGRGPAPQGDSPRPGGVEAAR